MAEVADVMLITFMEERKSVPFHYRILVEGKDARYKYSIYDIYFDYSSYDAYTGTTVSKLFAEAVFDINQFYEKNGQEKDAPRRYRDALAQRIKLITDELKNSIDPPVEKKW